MEPHPVQPPFTLLLASVRWAVRSLFDGLREHGLPTLVVVPFEDVDRADVAAIDLAPDPAAALELCGEVRVRRPTLPILALLCCPEAVNPRQLHELLREGANLIDLQASPEELVRALRNLAQGSSVLNLHLRAGQRALVRDILSGRAATTETRIQILQLLARGLPDHEIGATLHLSPHTAKHHIDT